ASESLRSDPLPFADREARHPPRLPDDHGGNGGGRNHGTAAQGPADSRRAIPSRIDSHPRRENIGEEFLGTVIFFTYLQQQRVERRCSCIYGTIHSTHPPVRPSCSRVPPCILLGNPSNRCCGGGENDHRSRRFGVDVGRGSWRGQNRYRQANG